MLLWYFLCFESSYSFVYYVYKIYKLYGFSQNVEVKMFGLQMSARRPAILTEVFRGVSRSLQANAWIVP
jgi:hypothetical protein